MLYTIRTTSGREDIVTDMIETRLKGEGIDVKSVVHPAEIKGYVFVEGSLTSIHKLIQGMLHVRGIIEKPIRLEEIQRFLEYKKARITIDLGDIVEIVGGSFKSEKGKITRVDKVKGEVTIELLEASIPIPVTIATEFVKVIKRAKPEKKEPETPRRPEKPESMETPGTQLEEEAEEPKVKEEPEGEEAELSEEEEEQAEKKVEEEAKEEEAVSELEEKSVLEQIGQEEPEEKSILEELAKEEGDKKQKKKKTENEEFE